MEKRMYYVLIFTVVFLGMGTFFMVPGAAMSRKQLERKYLNWDQKHNGTDGCYRMVDVDKNGIDEFLSSDYALGQFRILTYNKKTKRVVKLKSVVWGKGGSVGYKRSSHTFYIQTADTGGSHTTFYKLSGTKIKKIKKAEYMNGKFERYGYRINGKRVKTSVYKKAFKGYKNANLKIWPDNY